MVDAALHPPVLWSSTRSRLLDIMRTRGTVSRVELVGITGLTPGTISNVVRDLLNENLVCEVGHARSRGGQPRRLLQLQAQAHYAVGVQMDRCTSSVVLADFGGRLIAQRTLQGSGSTSPEEMLTLLSRQILDLLAAEQIPHAKVLGASLVTYGPQDRLNGKLMAPRPTPEWYGHPLAPSLSELTGLPVLLENDATAAALGEQWLGEVEVDTFGVIYMASGLGGGVIVDREVYRGGGSNTVELGHISIDASGPPCECGNRGCIETTYGTSAVIARALSDTRLGAHLNLTGKPGDTLADFDRLSQAAIDGDAHARALLEDAAYGLGQAAVTLVNLFDLHTVVLAGPAFSVAGPLMRDGISKVLNQSAFSRELRPINVVLSSHGSLAAAVGGALQVLRTPAGAATTARTYPAYPTFETA